MFHGVAGKFQHDYDTPAVVHATLASVLLRQPPPHAELHQRRSRSILRATRRGSSACPRSIAWWTARCGATTMLRELRARSRRGRRSSTRRPGRRHSSLNLMGVELVDRAAGAILERHRQAARSLARPAAVLLRRRRLAGPPRQRDGRQDRRIWCPDADICPYLAAADVMITDHSSAGFEYLLLDRPLVRIHVPELLRGSNISEEYVAPAGGAPRGRSIGPLEALRAVEQALADPAAGSPSRRAVARGAVLSARQRDGAGGRRVVRRHGAGAAAAAPAAVNSRAAVIVMVLDVILPTFNREALLARTLESLRAARRPEGAGRPRARRGQRVDRRHERRSCAAQAAAVRRTLALSVRANARQAARAECRHRRDRRRPRSASSTTTRKWMRAGSSASRATSGRTAMTWTSSAGSVCRSGVRPGPRGSATGYLGVIGWVDPGPDAESHGRGLSRHPDGRQRRDSPHASSNAAGPYSTALNRTGTQAARVRGRGHVPPPARPGRARPIRARPRHLPPRTRGAAGEARISADGVSGAACRSASWTARRPRRSRTSLAFRDTRSGARLRGLAYLLAATRLDCAARLDSAASIRE